MGKLTLALLLLLGYSQSLAKDTEPTGLEDLRNQKGIEDPLEQLLSSDDPERCRRMFLNAEKLIPLYYRRGQRDSIDIVIHFLDQECREGHFADLELLLAIEDGHSFADYCNELLFKDMIGIYTSYTSFQMLSSNGLYSNESQGDGYGDLLSDIVQGLIERTDSTTVAHMICRYFAGDKQFIRSQLANGQVEPSCFKNFYERSTSKIRHDLIHKLRVHASVNAGTWTPLDRMSTLGPKVEFGFSLGVRKNRLGADFLGIFRAMSAKEDYRVKVDNTIRSTGHYFGAYFGLEGTFEFLRVGQYASELLVGIGYDGFDAFAENDDYQKSINSLNLNVGLAGRFYTTETKSYYLGYQIRYNLVKYGTGGGTDLSGDAISFNLVFGFLGNEGAIRQARNLGIFKQKY